MFFMFLEHLHRLRRDDWSNFKGVRVPYLKICYASACQDLFAQERLEGIDEFNT